MRIKTYARLVWLAEMRPAESATGRFQALAWVVHMVSNGSIYALLRVAASKRILSTANLCACAKYLTQTEVKPSACIISCARRSPL